MSAPETNIEKEKRRSKPVLIAIGIAVVLVLGIAFLIAASGANDTDPEALPDPLDAVTEDGAETE